MKKIIIILLFCVSLFAESDEKITQQQRIKKSKIAMSYLDRKLKRLRLKIEKENNRSKRLKFFLDLKKDLADYYTKHSRYFTDAVRNEIGLYNTVYLASFEGANIDDAFCYHVEEEMRSAFKAETKDSLPQSAIKFIDIISEACAN